MSGIPAIAPYDPPRVQDVCRNVAGWEADPRRAVLLVHDMQRYFLRPFPADQEPRRSVEAHAQRLVTICRELGVPVAYTAQPGMSSAQRGLLVDFWGPGMATTREDREIVEPLRPDVGDWVFTKWRYSAFFHTGLLDRMRHRGRDQLIVCGVYAHVGVLMTAVEAFTHDIQCFLAADAVADFDADRHAMALEYAASRCAVVAETDHLLADLVRPPAAISA